MKQVDTIILVKELDVSRKFYELHFGLNILHDWDSMVIYKNRLALHQMDLIQPKSFADILCENNNTNNNVIIYIELDVDDSLEDKLAELEKANVTIMHGIYELPWQRIIRVLDPDGNIIEVGEPGQL